MDSIWERATGCTKETVREVLDVSKGRPGQYQGDWWWNKEVKKKVEMEKVA